MMSWVALQKKAQHTNRPVEHVAREVVPKSVLASLSNTATPDVLAKTLHPDGYVSGEMALSIQKCAISNAYAYRRGRWVPIPV